MIRKINNDVSMKDILLKKLIMICKKYIGEEETNEIINDTIGSFKKEYTKKTKELKK